MLIAILLVPFVALTNTGGFTTTINILESMPTNLLQLNNFTFLAVVSALGWGLGYFGQPHIIVRFMAIRSVADLTSARRIGISWMVFSISGAILVGLVGAAYISSNGLELADPETIFILLANTLFHPLVSGFLLAAILAAIMSTISSQLLVASSSLTEDIYHTFIRPNSSQNERLFVARTSVVLVSVLALVLAHDRDSSILSLVSNAWAGVGAAFGPVILLSLIWDKMTLNAAIAGMVSGAMTVALWLLLPIQINNQSLSQNLYELVPGFCVSLFVIVIVSYVSKVGTDMKEKHEEFKRQLEY